MQITFLNVRYSCKPTCHNRFALACVRLHRALGHALCKGLGPMRRLAFVEEPVERGLGRSAPAAGSWISLATLGTTWWPGF